MRCTLKKISPTSFEVINEVMNQIEATKEHKRSQDNDTNMLLDLDLAVLGDSSESYQKYANAIRKEYKI